MWVWVILLALHTQTGTITPSHPQARTLSEISERGFVEGVRSETRWTCRKRSSRAWFKLPLSNLPWEDPPHTPNGSRWGWGHLLPVCAAGRESDGQRNPGGPPGPRVGAARVGRGAPRGRCVVLGNGFASVPCSLRHETEPLCERLGEYEVLAVLILFTGIFVPLSVTEACY